MSITAKRLEMYQIQMSIYAEQHKLILATDVLDMIEQLQDDLNADIEKVVADLKEWTFNADVNIGDGTITNHDLIASEIAIDIVKRGGVDECDVCDYETNYSGSDKYKIETGCGYTFYDLHHAEPFKYCPYCGKKIKVVE